MQRIALGLEYEGASYSGWQRQINRPSIQEKLELALSKVANQPISVICAGRTDAGVHASCQIIHFDTMVKRDSRAWIHGVNNFLPKNIRINWAQCVTNNFDARRSALARRYCYVIANSSGSPGIMHNKVAWVYGALDEKKMHQGAQLLLGNHDFTSFRATQCQSRTPMRTIYEIQVFRKGHNIIVDVTANAFLYHMVRNIVGSLLLVGKQKKPPAWMFEVLDAKDRKQAGYKAPAHGLYLIDVRYPTEILNPPASSLPWFL